jgi:hypothetical protein
MEVSSSFWRIEKVNERSGTIFLREFKATFSIVVCELDFKYGTNYTEAFAFIQLARYVQYEALDVYEQHFSKIFGIIQILNLAYAIVFATALQLALQAAIAHHGIVPNHPDLIPTSVSLSPQQFIVVTTNILPIIDAPAFANPVGEFFRVFELEFSVTNFEKILQLTTSFGRRMKPSRCSIGGFSSLKRILRAS